MLLFSFLQAFFSASDLCVPHEEPKNIETHNVVIRDDNIYHTKDIFRRCMVVLPRITGILPVVSYRESPRLESSEIQFES